MKSITAQEAKQKTDEVVKNQEKEYDELIRDDLNSIYEHITRATTRGSYNITFTTSGLDIHGNELRGKLLQRIFDVLKGNGYDVRYGNIYCENFMVSWG
jgi:hypothetical protein